MLNIAVVLLLIALFCPVQVMAGSTQPVHASTPGNLSYTTAEGARQPTLPRWDFSRGQRYIYDVTLDTHEVEKNRTGSTNRLSLRSEKTTMDGTLSVTSTFDKHARLDLVSQTRGERLDGNGATVNIPEARSTHVVDSMSDAGLFKTRSLLDYLLAMVMAQPGRPLIVGDSVLLDYEVPIGADSNGTLVFLQGQMALTLSRFVHCDDRLCAELKSTIDINRHELNNTHRGDHTATTTLTGTQVFDIDNGRLVEYSGTLRTHMDSDWPVETSGHSASEDRPSSHRVLTRDTRIAVQYREENRSRGQKLTIRKYQRPAAE